MTYADGNVTGNDFNPIVDSLKQRNRGGVLGQVMSWMKTVSSPTGGGIRHGMDLKWGTELGAAEQRQPIRRRRMTVGLKKQTLRSRRPEGQLRVDFGASSSGRVRTITPEQIDSSGRSAYLNRLLEPRRKKRVFPL
ncbi:hypothetical protein [Ralstonia syzygii]|uniref:Hypothethical protein n=1 Tax=Ralstonia syzygii R24 TaxID=907261 RepID=G3ABV9_9RALS|nr:hypothetical protein [Ralstonia syzygii]CCA87023.1 hypothethical protein [Ralstonia syzygii R24]